MTKIFKAITFHVLAILVSVTLTTGALLPCLKLFDIYLISHRHAANPDEDTDEPTMRTMEYYPVTR